MSASTPAPGPTPGLAPPTPVPDRRRRLLILGICCMSLFIVGLDSTIVNLALPSIRSDLSASVAKLQWTIDAYTLVIASLLMVSGSTADRVGRRRTFQVGLVLFGVGSLLCGFAQSVDQLIVFRMLQAIGGSMLNPVAMSIITNTFTAPRERAQAIGVWGGVVGLSMAVGPVEERVGARLGRAHPEQQQAGQQQVGPGLVDHGLDGDADRDRGGGDATEEEQAPADRGGLSAQLLMFEPEDESEAGPGIGYTRVGEGNEAQRHDVPKGGIEG